MSAMSKNEMDPRLMDAIAELTDSFRILTEAVTVQPVDTIRLVLGLKAIRADVDYALETYRKVR